MTRNLFTAVLLFLGSLALISCASEPLKVTTKASASARKVVKTQHGKASWYSIRTNGGTKTASGERLLNHASTAAHKTLPLGTKVRVVNLNNGKEEIVRITDRGPYVKGRIIDVTVGVAERLGFRSNGVVPVKVEVLHETVSTGKS